MASNNDRMCSKLSSSSLPKSKQGSKSKPKQEVADSWEDEDVSEPDEPTSPKATSSTEATPAAPPPPPPPPPPTPATPSFGDADDAWSHQGGSPQSFSARDGGGRRPEKTDAVARRLIAAGLGLKAPKQTDEQRAYQKSVREQERKRREQERAEEQKRADASERAKTAVWDD
ncbi:uncharacterized protein BBA_04202 [Beauveria bassiana ARSEF 2860]|uniref:Ubiquitin-like protein smt3 n=1 Tax=Beauveria bassiana (strain ARSEF 2860) TaxID=655819 RepID=J4KP64_BEAB2|nr:uncharacterized protein BBA_04202 [Beauveria bassiana ARSEF 2860]EJP66909.1 hypothetical protein BBA_04202 [Beauveria bassiana ARSEF 2860]